LNGLALYPKLFQIQHFAALQEQNWPWQLWMGKSSRYGTDDQ